MRHRDQAYTVVPESLTLGQRLGRFFGLLGVVFVVALAVIVTQRLSRDSLALLIGLSCGVAAMLPTLALGLFVWRREDARRQAQEQAPAKAPMLPTPPVIVISPQALPGYANPETAPGSLQPQGWQWAMPQSQRSFTIVGDEE